MKFKMSINNEEIDKLLTPYHLIYSNPNSQLLSTVLIYER